MEEELTALHTKETHKFSEDEKAFILGSLVVLGRGPLIQAAVQEKYGKSISPQYISDLRNEPRNQPILEKLRSEYEKGSSREYMTSKRKRVSAMTEIYEIAMEHNALKLAKECIQAIDDMMENAKSKNYQFFQFQQYNNYADMPLAEIRKERAKLLKQLEGVKMMSSEKIVDVSPTEVTNGE